MAPHLCERKSTVSAAEKGKITKVSMTMKNMGLSISYIPQCIDYIERHGSPVEVQYNSNFVDKTKDRGQTAPSDTLLLEGIRSDRSKL